MSGISLVSHAAMNMLTAVNTFPRLVDTARRRHTTRIVLVVTLIKV